MLSIFAYNLGNLLRTTVTPETIKDLSLTALKEILVKIGAKVVSHGRYLAFQMAEVGHFTAFTRRHPGVAGLGATAATSGRIDVKRSIVVPSLQR